MYPRWSYLAITIVTALCFQACQPSAPDASTTAKKDSTTAIFTPPDTSTIPHDENGDMIRYGRDLIVNFSKYLGPKGTVGRYGGNNMSCQNCHLDAGTRPYGLNYFSAHARYPQFRAREAKILTLGDRVNNCIERPLNGRAMPLDSKEMVAILCYMQWLGKGVPVGKHVEGDDLKKVALLDRAADPEKGRAVYNTHCMRCHGADGAGVANAENNAFIYPALWGPKSYQPGSSMHRVIKSSQFIKYNMPFDLARWDKPVLTDEEAMDVAAFVNDDNLHTRPAHLGIDYPVDRVKPIDIYKPPYADPFPQHQHKYGPFKPIIAWRKQHGHPTGY